MEWKKKVAKTDLSTVELDTHSSTLSVKFDMTVTEAGAVAEFEDEIDMDEAPHYLRVAASKFTDAIMQALRESAENPGDIKCNTCTGACCFAFSSIRVTADDLLRLEAGGINLDAAVDLFPEHAEGMTDWTGYVGQMKEKPVTAQISRAASELEKTGCVFLTEKGCSVYEHRPQVCRDFSAWTCDETYEEDSRKVSARKNGKTTLRVVQP
jgi:Fe-S-cluster containining protein